MADLARVLASPTFRDHVESRSPGRIPECIGCEVEGLCQGNASMALVYERATGRPGLFAHRCELIRAMTRGVLAEPDDPPALEKPPVRGCAGTTSTPPSLSRSSRYGPGFPSYATTRRP